MQVPTDDILIPVDALVNGENVVTITNDADTNDSWSAAGVYIEIHGVLSLPRMPIQHVTTPDIPSSDVGATAIVSSSVWLNSSYDGIQHQVWYQIPDGYDGASPTPLLVGTHAWGQDGEGLISFMGSAVDERGWLFVAPDTHGRYYLDGTVNLIWPGAQHDILDAVEYMVANYNVDTSRVYIAGFSMGGQTTTTMAAKYPDVFAAAAAWIGPTDLAEWYAELRDLPRYSMLRQIRREIDPSCDPVSDTDYVYGCGTPATEPFEYQRRSAMAMPQNSRLVPLHMWHNEADELVPVHHSLDLAAAINAWFPPTPITVTTVVTAGCTDTYKHCYDPEFEAWLGYLASHTRNVQPPPSVMVRTDESKPYYWLNAVQTGDAHWSAVEASYTLVDRTVTAVISDTQPLTLALNLGSTPAAGGVVERAGMGLPGTTYLVQGGGNNGLYDYTSGYLTTTLSTVGQSLLTISAIEAEVSAAPNTVLGTQVATSTIVAVVKDQLGNPVPNGTVVEFSTTEGTFPNAGSTYTATTIAEGIVTTTLTLEPGADLAEITAGVGSITVSTAVDAIYPAVEIVVTPRQMTTAGGHVVTYTYQLSNTGDATLTAVAVVDDNGTPTDGSDDLDVCEGITLAPEATINCVLGVALTETMIRTTTVTGQDPVDGITTDKDSVIVTVYYSVFLPIISRGD